MCQKNHLGFLVFCCRMLCLVPCFETKYTITSTCNKYCAFQYGKNINRKWNPTIEKLLKLAHSYMSQTALFRTLPVKSQSPGSRSHGNLTWNSRRKRAFLWPELCLHPSVIGCIYQALEAKATSVTLSPSVNRLKTFRKYFKKVTNPSIGMPHCKTHHSLKSRAELLLLL